MRMFFVCDTVDDEDDDIGWEGEQSISFGEWLSITRRTACCADEHKIQISVPYMCTYIYPVCMHATYCYTSYAAV